jgi:hypothetical protein
VTPAERYLELGLRLGRHVDGLVDSYCGPPELAARVEAEELVPVEALLGDAFALEGELDHGWLRDQVHGCVTYARVLAGEEIAYSDEVEGCYGVRPERVPLAVYEAAHAELDELLPGEGSLFERRQAWRDRQLVSGAKVVEAARDLLPLMRRRTLDVVELPDGENLTVEPVNGEPWWAFNYYQGDLASRVAINVDVPTTGFDLLHLVAHEAYPGHHTERAVKEQRLVRERGLLEEAIQPVPVPAALVSEGIAELGQELVVDDGTREEAAAILRSHGVDVPDIALAERVSRAARPLGTVGLDAALMVHEDGVSHEEAQAFVERWRLATPEQALRSVRFATDPTWRAYVVTYSAGEDLCRAWVAGDATRFERLLAEHVRVGELTAAA